MKKIIFPLALILTALLILMISMIVLTPIGAEEVYRCETIEGLGDHASYQEGWHQIYGGGLLWGQDNVYSVNETDYLQCYCGEDGQGIETFWKRSQEGNVNGEQWNLGDHQYFAFNREYNCGPEPTPTPTPEPQACNRHCVTNDDCRRLDPNYICYFKTQECRQEHNSEDKECHPAPEQSSVPLPDEGIQPLGPQK